ELVDRLLELAGLAVDLGQLEVRVEGLRARLELGAQPPLRLLVLLQHDEVVDGVLLRRLLAAAEPALATQAIRLPALAARHLGGHPRLLPGTSRRCTGARPL